MLQHGIIRSTTETGAFHESLVVRLGTLNEISSHGDVRWSQPLLLGYDHRHRPTGATRHQDAYSVQAPLRSPWDGATATGNR